MVGAFAVNSLLLIEESVAMKPTPFQFSLSVFGKTCMSLHHLRGFLLGRRRIIAQKYFPSLTSTAYQGDIEAGEDAGAHRVFK